MAWLVPALFALLLTCSAGVAQSLLPTETQSSPEASPEGLSPDAARALAEILQDEKARAALVDRLMEISGDAAPAEASPGEEASAEEPGAGEPPAEDAGPGIARRIAEYTQGLAETVGSVTAAAGRQASSIWALFDVKHMDFGRIAEAAWSLAAVAGITLGIYLVLRQGVVRVFALMARGAEGRGWLHKTLLLVGSSVVDAIMIVGAWGGGYAFALAIGEASRMDIRQSLFLNAFLLIELVKVLMRGVLAPGFGRLRLLPLGDTPANYWYFWLSRVVSLLGYGTLLVVPIVSANISLAAANGVQLLVALTAAIMAIAVILQNRSGVRERLKRRATRKEGDWVARILAVIGRFWHLLAIAYVVALFLVWLIDPRDGLEFMVLATAESAVAIVLGVLFVVFISRAIAGGMHLPDELKRRLPLLEQRLNAFVPTILRVVRVVVLVTVFIVVAHIWHLFNMGAWIASAGGRQVTVALASAGIVVLVAIGIYLAVASWIDYRLNPGVGKEATPRERTLLLLFSNAFTVALVVVTLMLTLSELGLDIGPLLAGAGVLGLAIGFGSQKMVQDIITGAFIQLENAMNEGDVVTVGGITGTVERLTVRSVGLRDLSGVYHLIPFSSVDSVSNFMKGFAYHVAEIGVAYRERIPEVKELMVKSYERLKETEHGNALLDPELEMHGVTQFADSAIVVRARIRTRPGFQWAVGRAYNEIIKEVFDEAGVEIPFPHLTLYMGQDKDGTAPALRLLDEARRAGEEKAAD